MSAEVATYTDFDLKYDTSNSTQTTILNNNANLGRDSIHLKKHHKNPHENNLGLPVKELQ